VGVIFEKENINTLDAKGEVLLTILSSLAQDESRTISENSTWGIRRRFENGQFKMSTKRFLGYDTDENGKLVINREQAKIVERIYDEYLSGKTIDYIKRMEGYGVAFAACDHGLPILEVRAISNLVGPRDRAAWRIKEALEALEASAELLEVL